MDCQHMEKTSRGYQGNRAGDVRVVGEKVAVNQMASMGAARDCCMIEYCIGVVHTN